MEPAEDAGGVDIELLFFDAEACAVFVSSSQGSYSVPSPREPGVIAFHSEVGMKPAEDAGGIEIELLFFDAEACAVFVSSSQGSYSVPSPREPGVIAFHSEVGMKPAEDAGGIEIELLFFDAEACAVFCFQLPGIHIVFPVPQEPGVSTLPVGEVEIVGLLGMQVSSASLWFCGCVFVFDAEAKAVVVFAAPGGSYNEGPSGPGAGLSPACPEGASNLYLRLPGDRIAK
ncbi:hypothetical protein N7457_001223 [Penicillium paradoxum]|uniref:uncharacterized protein n=1 Tax=Penicillium paradoxum TaxID=176176 RepID=UPI0025486F13|nr:uncharacterized protein N7457_001223 [Penicillium paradoxum]KAJ5794624.1 hypothetical protein N7457_001223 [Penicillium paradoxum]